MCDNLRFAGIIQAYSEALGDWLWYWLCKVSDRLLLPGVPGLRSESGG